MKSKLCLILVFLISNTFAGELSAPLSFNDSGLANSFVTFSVDEIADLRFKGDLKMETQGFRKITSGVNNGLFESLPIEGISLGFFLNLKIDKIENEKIKYIRPDGFLYQDHNECAIAVENQSGMQWEDKQGVLIEGRVYLRKFRGLEVGKTLLMGTNPNTTFQPSISEKIQIKQCINKLLLANSNMRQINLGFVFEKEKESYQYKADAHTESTGSVLIE